MKQRIRWFGKELLMELLMAFFVCTSCICILEGILGMFLMPEVKFGYEAFFSPPVFGFFSILFSVVTKSRHELSIKEILLRRLLHLLLIEGLVFGLNYLSGVVYDPFESVMLALSIAVVFVTVYVVMYMNDSRSAARFNEELRRYQERLADRDISV